MQGAEALPAARGRLLAFLALPLVLPLVRAEDCDRNGVEDALDLAPAFQLAGASLLAAVGDAVAARAADLDGDRRPEVVFASREPAALTVLRGQGGRDFAEQGRQVLPLPPMAVELADLDGDGDLDACVAANGFPQSGALFRLRNDGSGGLGEPERLPFELSPWALAALDLDGDGLVDLAAADRPANRLVVLRGLEGGAFAEGTPIVTGRGPVAFATADLDRDGDLDIASADELASTVTLAWNDGGGAFSPGLGIRGGRLPRRVVASDFDGDALSDLAVLSRASLDLKLLGNQGERAFGESSTFTFGEEPVDIAVGDLERDGDADFAILQNGKEGAELITNDPDPHSLVTVLQNGGGGAWTKRPSLSVGAPAAFVLSADLEGDGAPDLAFGLGQGGIGVLWNGGHGGYQAAIRRPVFSGDPFVAGDLDRDGDADLALLQKGLSPAIVLWNGGNGDYAEEVEIPVTFANGIAMGDLDADGGVDLAFADRPAPWQSGPDTIAFFWNQADEGFLRGEPAPVDSYGVFVAAGDGDGDGDLDLVFTDAGGDLSFLGNQGGRTFGEIVTSRFEWEVSVPLPADLDGDGDADLALPIDPRLDLLLDKNGDRVLNERGEPIWIVEEPGAVAVLLSDGPGLHRDVERIPAARWASSLAAGDLDGDEDLDLAVADRDAKVVSGWLNDGGAGFSPGTTLPARGAPVSLAAGDLDGDGDVDLTYVGQGVAAAWALINDGHGDFMAPRGFALNGDPYCVRAIDVDGSGSLAIVALGRDSDELWIFRNLTRPPAATDCDGNGRLDSCDIASGEAADADGDGFPDACGARFRRGDVNADGRLDLSDALRILGFLFLGDPPALACAASADTDGGGRLDITDAVGLLAHLFLGAVAPAEPFRTCGFGPARDALGCASYPGCG
jgi:hypothetical protein